MGLKENALQTLEKVWLMRDILTEIEQLCKLILTEKKVDGDIIEFSLENKQKLIQAYIKRKTELQSLLNGMK